MKRVLLALAALLVLVGGGVTAAVLTGHLHLPFTGWHTPGHHAQVAVEETVPAITTNLSDPGGGHFAEVAITVSLRDAALAKTFEHRLPAVENAIIADVRERSTTQLAGSQGMQSLGAAVSTSVDQLLGTATAVRSVYFTQFVVQ